MLPTKSQKGHLPTNHLSLIPDTEHSQEELRFQALGKTNNNRMLFLSFTIRNNKVRIISARDASKKERREYEKKA